MGGAIESLSSNFSQWTMMSYVGRINYGLMDRYLLTASLRYDGSSRLSEGNKWALFPSAAIAWRITEEDFAKNLDWLSNLKLRFSYGQAGIPTLCLLMHPKVPFRGLYIIRSERLLP